ncbi:MAG: uracil-DNA glycosylase [Gammaproteobacteria bacterium]
MIDKVLFDQGCTKCRRLADFLSQVKKEYPDYHALPVPAFGDDAPELLIVGLAPGMHGANATGRPFTGDHAGIMLYHTLFKHGFSNHSESVSTQDDLRLNNCRITNAVKCLPPQNKPTTDEIKTCNHFLRNELRQLASGTIILALGTIAHNAVLKAFDLKIKDFRFSHGAMHSFPDGKCLYDSYHCSRYNTQTGRLTQQMFDDVFLKIVAQLENPS